MERSTPTLISPDYIQGYEDGWTEALAYVQAEEEERKKPDNWIENGEPIPARMGWNTLINQGYIQYGDIVVESSGGTGWYMDRKQELAGIHYKRLTDSWTTI